jgi:DNA excision repair protein ERCC-2
MDILGSDDGDYRITIKSPFDKEKLCLMVANNIKTQYSVRELSYKCVAEYIYAAVSIKMGNYIVFFPSYKYLNEVYKVFKELYPDIRTICQEGNMTEEESS